MSAKKLLPLVIIVAVLAALALLQRPGGEQRTLEEQVGFATLAPEDLKAKDVTRIEIFTGAKPDEKVTIEREGEEAWRVASHFNAQIGRAHV